MTEIRARHLELARKLEAKLEEANAINNELLEMERTEPTLDVKLAFTTNLATLDTWKALLAGVAAGTRSVNF